MLNCNASIPGRNPYRPLVITITTRVHSWCTGGLIRDIYEGHIKKINSHLAWKVETVIELRNICLADTSVVTTSSNG